jgi:hypothetical protein
VELRITGARLVGHYRVLGQDLPAGIRPARLELGSDRSVRDPERTYRVLFPKLAAFSRALSAPTDLVIDLSGARVLASALPAGRGWDGGGAGSSGTGRRAKAAAKAASRNGRRSHGVPLLAVQCSDQSFGIRRTRPGLIGSGLGPVPLASWALPEASFRRTASRSRKRVPFTTVAWPGVGRLEPPEIASSSAGGARNHVGSRPLSLSLSIGLPRRDNTAQEERGPREAQAGRFGPRAVSLGLVAGGSRWARRASRREDVDRLA